MFENRTVAPLIWLRFSGRFYRQKSCLFFETPPLLLFDEHHVTLVHAGVSCFSIMFCYD